MACPGTLSPCTSPSKAARLSGNWPNNATSPVRLTMPSFAARKQHQRIHKYTYAAGGASAGPTAACSASSSSLSCSTASAPHVQPLLRGAAGQQLTRRGGFHSSRFGSVVRRNAPAGGPNGPTSSNTAGDGFEADLDQSAAFSALQRATSPITTAEQPYTAPDSSNSAASSSSSAPGAAPEAQGLASTAEPQEVLLNPAAAAAVALPAVGGSPSAGIDGNMLAAAAAAAAAEAAVAGALESQAGHGLSPHAPPQLGATAAGELQDLFTLLKLQVAANAPTSQLAATLVPIVRCAAANQLTLPFIMAADRHALVLKLLQSEDAAVAVLAAEVWCRLCGEPGLESWSDALLPAVPVLLTIIHSNAAAGDRSVPLLFFAVSSLVRMATLPTVAQAVQQQGGLPMLVAALHIVPAAICQVTTFALFRLMRELNGDLTDDQLSNWQQPQAQEGGGNSGSVLQEQPELVLVTYVRAGVFGKLCQVLAQVEEGSAHELAFSMMLSLALIPAAQQLVADQGEIQQLVQVMASPPTPAVRLEAMLVLGRLAARNRACQQDAVREGVVPVLVDMMMHGSEEERCHSCRLLAILGQHETTHQMILRSDALPVMLQLLRNQGLNVPVGSAQFITAQRQNPEPWHEAPPNTIDSLASGADADSDSDSDSESESEGHSGRYRTSGPFKAPQRPASPAAAAAAGAASGGRAVGPELVLEQAAGLACMLCHNANNHFLLVNQGIVPLLVMQLQQGTAPKTVTYTLASLLMLCMGDSRNAAVVARAGAIPALVSMTREGSYGASNRELAAALLAVMCRSQAAQVDVVASGGIPALTRLLAEGTAGARCSAAEALTQVAATSDVRCRLIVRAGALPHLTPMLQPASKATSVLWAARLLKALAQERNTLWEVCETPGLLELLPDLLKRKANQQQLDQLIREFRSAAAAATTAAAEAGAASGNTTETDADWKASTRSNDGVQAAVEAGTGQQGGDGGAEDAASGEDNNLEKAQAHIAWLLAALASDPRTRDIMAELAPATVRPLVVMLRDSQEASGPGYTLHDVLHGMANNRQAAASAALRALGKHVRIAGLIQTEIALQHWMGHNVQLPKAMGEWPSPTPGWFLNVDWWRSDEDKASWT